LQSIKPKTESFIDYGIIENSQNQIARAMELKKVHINPRFPKSEFSLDNIERIMNFELGCESILNEEL